MENKKDWEVYVPKKSYCTFGVRWDPAVSKKLVLRTVNALNGKEKVYTLKLPAKGYADVVDTHLSRKYLYLAVRISPPSSEPSRMVFYRMNVNGKQAPQKVLAVKNVTEVEKMTDSAINYSKRRGGGISGEREHYQYNIKTKNTTKIS